jgi:hypothetical protein
MCTTVTVYSKQLITYMWVWEPHENMYSIRERVHEWPSLLLPIHKHIYLKRIWRMRQRGNWPWYFVILKSKSTVYLLTTFVKRLQSLKQEWQEKPCWDQANRRQKLGLVWRIRKKISQIIKDYFYLPFFLLIILWFVLTHWAGIMDIVEIETGMPKGVGRGPTLAWPGCKAVNREDKRSRR